MDSTHNFQNCNSQIFLTNSVVSPFGILDSRMQKATRKGYGVMDMFCSVSHVGVFIHLVC